MPERSWASSDAVRRSMLGNRSRDTAPELAVRRLLHSRGLRYRVNARPVPDLRRTADLIFRGPKIAIFIDGCYWHGCPQHYTSPVTNAGYWQQKVNRNRLRDRETTRLLEEAGWTVLRFWAHQDPAEVAREISVAVAGNLPTRPRLPGSPSSP